MHPYVSVYFPKNINAFVIFLYKRVKCEMMYVNLLFQYTKVLIYVNLTHPEKRFFTQKLSGFFCDVSVLPSSTKFKAV